MFFSDSDGQYFPADFWQLWANRCDYDMVIGQKVVRREDAYRIVLAKGFHWLVNLMFRLNLHDIDCGFRVIRSNLIDSIIEEVGILEYSFWAEFTIRARLKGFRILEVPIRHSNRSFGDSHIYRTSKIPFIVIKQFVGLLRLYADVRKNPVHPDIGQTRQGAASLTSSTHGFSRVCN